MLTAVNQKKKAWIIAGVSTLLVLSCAGVVYVDHGKIQEERANIAGLQQQMTKAEGRIAKIPSIENRVLKERMVVKEYVKILPNDTEINNFVNTITQFANDTGVEIESLDDKSAQSRNRRKSKGAFVKIIYKMSLKGTTTQFLDFVHRFETYGRFVKVNQLAIKNESNQAEETTGPQRHAIDLELETYVYNPRTASKREVDIVNAQQKLEKILQTEPVTEALALEQYDYASQPDRRDPFADPRIARGEGDQNESYETQLATLEELIQEFGKIQDAAHQEEDESLDLVTRADFARQLNDVVVKFDQRVSDLKKSGFFSDARLKERFDAEVGAPFAAFFAERKNRMSPGLVAKQIEAEYQRMEKSFEQARYDDVLARAKALANARSSSPEGAEAERVKSLFEKVDRLARRAEAHQEFARKSLNFSGYVFQPSRPERAVVIINDRAYSPGDAMDDGVVVRDIEPTRVVFLYKDEEITRVIE